MVITASVIVSVTIAIIALGLIGVVFYALPRIEQCHRERDRQIVHAIHAAHRQVMLTRSVLGELERHYAADFRAALSDIPADRIAALYQTEEA